MKSSSTSSLAPLSALVLAGMLGACSPDGSEPAGSTDPSTTAASANVSILARGGQFRGINGIHFGPDGNLYLASVVTPAVAAIDPESGEIVHNWGLDDGPTSPDDLAFDAEGAVYWTDISDGLVGKRTASGESSVIADLGAGVNPITFSDDGRLFVSQCFMGTHLFEVDPSGQAEPRLIRDDLGPGCGLNGMDWSSAEGRLYGPRWFLGEVVSMDVDSGDFETVASGFGVPAAVKFDSQGRLHVLDALEGEIVRVDLASGTKEVVGRALPGLDNIAFGPGDRLFVSSFADGFVLEVLGPDENRTVLEGGINMPGGIAVLGAGADARILLADFFALRQLDPSTGEELATVRDVIGFSDLGSVMSVHTTAAGQLVLTSWFDNAVRLWNPADNALVEAFTDFQLPIDALMHGDTIVVSEWGSSQVLSFDPASPEERRPLAGGLQGPAGLATHGNSVYVSENLGGRVLKVAHDGQALAQPEVIAEGLSGPEGIAATDDALYVVEGGAKQVTRIDLSSGAVSSVATGLDVHVPPSGSFPATMLFNGIAASADRLYVSGDAANVVYTIDLEQ